MVEVTKSWEWDLTGTGGGGVREGLSEEVTFKGTSKLCKEEGKALRQDLAPERGNQHRQQAEY